MCSGNVNVRHILSPFSVDLVVTRCGRSHTMSQFQPYSAPPAPWKNPYSFRPAMTFPAAPHQHHRLNCRRVCVDFDRKSSNYFLARLESDMDRRIRRQHGNFERGVIPVVQGSHHVHNCDEFIGILIHSFCLAHLGPVFLHLDRAPWLSG